ncbi:NADPH-dependent FMN reductase [Pseudoxanthomonas wuyuanensis]|uniref:Chromate reductase n=1 Tax=Pseudoxanthomonas wuyuanensis TaxID=1073196 RepID=A0A286D8U3_9GAMM|nr:NADPH-dependent FMN reductase [Pseudoxanthomonas wuyuanensis]KAF1718897.1 NAD(P)H-dependent oxidoreductase [Pseudoxanthomonas wuyuanensis]SOD55076.1 chromate reductase [Pseudoxanthomonas wuyuanensis]
MAKLKIAVFVGSLRRESFNRKLARAVEKLMPAEFSFDYIRIDHLPPYNQDFDENYPAECMQLKRQIEAADALLFVTPEYNRSIPGVLKNAVDIASRPWGANSFAGKPGAAIGISVGATGTGMAQQHLRNVLLYLDIALMGQPEVYVQNKDGLFDDDGNIGNEGTRKFLQGFADRFVAWVNAHPGRQGVS